MNNSLAEERRLLLLDAADDCIECANYLVTEAPNMGTKKEQRYRALADESVARAAALRKWADTLGEHEWHPIETAPRDVDALFWVRPTTKEDGGWFADTSGNPILSKGEGGIQMTRYGRWSALSKATHWMPLPAAPQVTRG